MKRSDILNVKVQTFIKNYIWYFIIAILFFIFGHGVRLYFDRESVADVERQLQYTEEQLQQTECELQSVKERLTEAKGTVDSIAESSKDIEQSSTNIGEAAESISRGVDDGTRIQQTNEEAIDAIGRVIEEIEQ